MDLREHACLLYASAEEQARGLAEYLRQGLAQGQRVVYILDQDAQAGALERLAPEIDLDDALDEGSLLVRTTDSTYLEDDAFSPERMIEILRETVDEALAAGYSGIRMTGEMIWATRGVRGAEELLRYEKLLNDVFPQLPVAGLCQYDTRAFSPEVLAGVLRAHPLVHAKHGLTANPYYQRQP